MRFIVTLELEALSFDEAWVKASAEGVPSSLAPWVAGSYRRFMIESEDGTIRVESQFDPLE